MIHNPWRNVYQRYEIKIRWLFCFFVLFSKCQIINFLERQKLYDVLEVALQCNPRWTLRMRAKKVKALMEVLRYRGKSVWFRSNKPAKLLGRFEWNRPERREMPGWSNEAAGWRQLSRHFCCIGRKKEETRNKQRKNIRNAMLGNTNLFCKIKERDKIHVAPKY